jgi:diguanylate cyclase (GGDEF)-like protein
MDRNQAQMPLPFTAVSALTAGCAAIGLGYLATLPLASDLSIIVIPIFAVLFTTLLVRAGERAIAQTRDEMETRIIRDPQTGLMPPHMAERLLDVEFAAAQRGRPLAIVLFSIDNFGRNAALHGDSAATRWRRAAARVLNQRTRGMNVSARCRADGTFMTILADVPLEGACTFATRVRREYASLLRAGEPKSFSAGVATFDVSMRSAADLIDRAERALARAQSEGGKVVMVGLATGGAARTAVDQVDTRVPA